ncbi:MAG: ClbS/DfsB family four-helix bundle protein [Spirulina sp.]
MTSKYHSCVRKIDGEFDAISHERERVKEIEGNVSCCDVIAYQIGWGKLLLGWEEKEKKGKEPKMPAFGN